MILIKQFCQVRLWSFKIHGHDPGSPWVDTCILVPHILKSTLTISSPWKPLYFCSRHVSTDLSTSDAYKMVTILEKHKFPCISVQIMVPFLESFTKNRTITPGPSEESYWGTEAIELRTVQKWEHFWSSTNVNRYGNALLLSYFRILNDYEA